MQTTGDNVTPRPASRKETWSAHFAQLPPALQRKARQQGRGPGWDPDAEDDLGHHFVSGRSDDLADRLADTAGAPGDASVMALAAMALRAAVGWASQGRTARAQRLRLAVLDAHAREARPNAAALARRFGVSRQRVAKLFSEMPKVDISTGVEGSER